MLKVLLSKVYRNNLIGVLRINILIKLISNYFDKYSYKNGIDCKRLIHVCAK